MRTDGILLAVILVALVGGYAGSQTRPAASVSPAAGRTRFGMTDAYVPVETFRKDLMSALGDSFEYLGGEVGRTTGQSGYWGAQRFWFAKVRAKKAGKFAVSYTIDFDFPPDDKWSNLRPEKAIYVIPIKIGDRHAPRVVQPGTFGGSAWPHANVGDALVIPINVDSYRTGHTFARVAADDRRVVSFLSVVGERQHERHLKQASKEPVVRNDAADWVDLLASWHRGMVSRLSSGPYHHDFTAYLEFRKTGEVSLSGRLADADEKGAAEGTSFRVRAKDKPVTVVIEHFGYKEYRGKETPLTGGSSGHVSSGTLQVRVGDRLIVPCGGYETPANQHEVPRVNQREAPPVRTGVITAGPFKNVEPFAPEPKKPQ